MSLFLFLLETLASSSTELVVECLCLGLSLSLSPVRAQLLEQNSGQSSRPRLRSETRGGKLLLARARRELLPCPQIHRQGSQKLQIRPPLPPRLDLEFWGQLGEQPGLEAEVVERLSSSGGLLSY